MRTRSSRRAPRLSPAERRARLLEAAARVFLRRGYPATKVRDVVREAGVSRGTFYLHFESKRNLLGALARELLDRLLPRLPSPPAMSARRDLEAALRALDLAAFTALDAERATARLLLGDGAGPDPVMARALAAHDEAWRRLVGALLARAQGAGLLREDLDTTLAIECVLGTVQRVARVSVLRDGRADLEALAASLARFQVAALSR